MPTVCTYTCTLTVDLFLCRTSTAGSPEKTAELIALGQTPPTRDTSSDKQRAQSARFNKPGVTASPTKTTAAAAHSGRLQQYGKKVSAASSRDSFTSLSTGPISPETPRDITDIERGRYTFLCNRFTDSRLLYLAHSKASCASTERTKRHCSCCLAPAGFKTTEELIRESEELQRRFGASGGSRV